MNELITLIITLGWLAWYDDKYGAKLFKVKSAISAIRKRKK